MGKIYSMLTRPIRTFNIANRAERVISREKPVAAPQYKYTEKQKELSNEINPNFLEEHYRKDMQLDQRLKDVFVTSTDQQEIVKPMKESKLLPQSRITDEYIFDFYDSKIPAGKCSLKQVFTFLSKHKNDPATYSSENIAAEYKMDQKIVDDILKHFKLYVTVSPKDPEMKNDPFQEMIYQTYTEQEKKKLEEQQQ